MKKKLLLGALLIGSLLSYQEANAQGCVAVRQMGGINAMSPSSSYNLQKGDVQVGANYRYFHSFRHFVGDVEQPQRQTLGNAVNIYSHAVDLNVSYGLTNRLQINATLPYVNNERSQTLTLNSAVAGPDGVKPLTRYSVYASGIADVRFSLNYWLINPEKAHKGNVMIGLGVKTKTGSYTATDDALQTDGTKKNVVMDQAIQPGDGGVGYSVEFTGFRQLGKSNVYGFANGYYLFSPQESNGSFKSAAKAGLIGYNLYASPDQYFGRIGAMTAFGQQKNIAVSLAGRFEGIPAFDAFGGQVAYRRPGYNVSIEPGITYRKGQHTFNIFVPFNLYRNRIQSAADIADENLQNASITDPAKKVHVIGDAAFADYSISIGYSFRISKSMKVPTWKGN